MKKLIFSILTVAAMVGCSSEDEIIDNAGNGNGRVEVKLNAGVSAIQTKAALESWSDTKVSFIKGTYNSEGSTYSFSELWNAQIASDNKVTFKNTDFTQDEPKYYPEDGTDIYLVGVCPAPTSVPTGNKVTFDLSTGDQDVVATVRLEGNKGKDKHITSCTFNHLLTKLNFKGIADETYPNNKKLTKLTIKGCKISAELDLTKASDSWALDFTGNATNITAFDKTTDTTNGVTIPEKNTAAAEITTVFVQPNATNITLDIIAGDTEYQNIPITIKGTDGQAGTAEEGKQYDITLTFSKESVTTTAELTKWGTAGEGSGTVK